MKKFFSGLSVLTLFIATGCGGGTPDKEQVAAPSKGEPSNEVVQREVKKPIAGEADSTFSLSVPYETVALTQGEEVSIRIGINRGANFGEQVAIEVSNLPNGVTMETKKPVITQGSEGVELAIKADSDAALGDFTAKLTGRTASSAADFSKEIKLTISPKQSESANQPE